MGGEGDGWGFVCDFHPLDTTLTLYLSFPFRLFLFVFFFFFFPFGVPGFLRVIPLMEFCLGSFPAFLCPIFSCLLLVETFFGYVFWRCIWGCILLLLLLWVRSGLLGTWSMGFGIASGSVLGRAWISAAPHLIPVFFIPIIIVGFFLGGGGRRT